MQGREIVGDCDFEEIVWFIPHRNRIYEQVNELSAEIFILNIPVLELVQPVDNLFPVKIGNALFLFLEFPFKNLLFLFQLHHALHKRFWGKTALNGLGDILKGQLGFMKSATNGRNIRGGFHFIRVGLNSNRGDFLNPFRREKG